MNLYTDEDFDKSTLPPFLKPDEVEAVELAARLGWKIHVNGNRATILSPDAHAPFAKSINFGRRNTIPLTRVRKDILKFADPHKLQQELASKGIPTNKVTQNGHQNDGATMTSTTKKTAAKRPVKQAAPAKKAVVPAAEPTVTETPHDDQPHRLNEVLHLPGTGITTVWEDVNPESAKEFLEHNTHNRKMADRPVAQLAADMAAGLYQITHQGVALSDDGVLLDGQHRLQAIIESNTTQTLLVTRGLPTHTQVAMDGGRKRLASDFMTGPYTTARAGAARIILAARQEAPQITASGLYTTMGKITTSEIIDGMTDKDLELLNGMAMHSAKAVRSIPTIGPSPMLAAAVIVIGDVEIAEDFFSGFTTMAGLGEGDPRIALMKVRGQTGKRFNVAQAFSLCVRTASAYMAGNEVRLLRPLPQKSVFLELEG